MGALTLKAFSDELREWEFIEGEGIDPTDSFGVNLRLSIREDQIFLAEPNDPNIPWLTDKGRLFFDGMFEKTKDKPTDWIGFFNEISETIYFVDHLNLHRFKTNSLLFVFENLSLETLNMLYLIKQTCSIIELRKAESHFFKNDLESHYQLGESMEKTKLHMSTLGVLIGVNPRYEGYVLNLNLRQRFLKGDFKLFNVGSSLDLTFPTFNLGSNFIVLTSLAEGTHVSCQDVKNAEFPFLVANTELFKRTDGLVIFQILKYVNVLDMAWSKVNVLNHNLGSAGIQYLNRFLPLTAEDLTNFFGLYCINTPLASVANVKSLIELSLLNIFKSHEMENKMFVDQSTKRTDNHHLYETGHKLFSNYYHLPCNLFLEDSETFINTQGLIKRTTKLIHFKKDSKTNWQITRKFYASVKSILFLNNRKDSKLISFNAVNSFSFRNYVNFQFYAVQTLTSLSFYLTKQNRPMTKSCFVRFKPVSNKIIDTKLKEWLDDFFNGSGKDSFSYNSSILVNCSKINRFSTTNFF